MSNKSNEKENPQSAKVLKLGFNISVSGDPGTDFEIVLDENEKKVLKSALQDEEQLKPDVAEVEESKTNLPKHEIEETKTQEVQSTGAIPKLRKSLDALNSSESLKISEIEMGDDSFSKDTSLIRKIKNTMEQFEKFSDHLKEIPRLRNHPIATSTPFSDKYNSKSESNLVYPEFRTKKYSHMYDYHSRKDYFKVSGRPSPPDLFLKPLPAEGYYKRGIYTRYIDLEPYRHYGSDNTLNKASECKSVCLKSSYDLDKYEESYAPSEPLSGILKKSDSESGDKQSTSSADSIKDIKIYQSGGILIMQNFKDNMNNTEKKEISEFSAKLIENCNKLRMEVSSFQENKPMDFHGKPAAGNSSDENKNLGKMVQFDLSSVEGQKSKSEDSSCNALKDESSGKMESSESISDCVKNKEASPPGTSQSQDFPSLSTQENDSVLSNQPGMSPTCTSSKKLEWDSGADIGYLNLDLSKENLSTIEKIVLKGLSSDGLSEKNVVYEKSLERNQINRSRFILERKPSDLVVEEIVGEAAIKSDVDTSDKGFYIEPKNEMKKGEGETEKQSIAEGIIKGENRLKFKETNPTPKNPIGESSPIRIPIADKLETSDKSINVNTLFQNASQQTPPVQTLSKESVKPRHKKLPKVNLPKSKKPSPQRLLRGTKKPSVSPTDVNLLSTALGAFEMGVPKKIYKKVEANPTINDVELSREVDEIIIDQRFKIKTGKEPEAPVKDQKEVKSKSRPISASSSSNNTVLPKSENKEDVEEKTKTSERKLTDQIIQTSDYDCQSVGVQAFASQMSSDCDFRSFRKNELAKQSVKEIINTSSKNIQAFGLNASLPKQLEHPKETEIFDKQNTKSTQFFGGPVNSLPNYHSNLVTKPGETCGRALNILKTKKTSETEIIRLREENEKNILANDAPKLEEAKRDSKRTSNNENKENLITQKSTNSRRTQSNASRKDSDSAKKDQNKAKKNSPSTEGSDCPHTSDEVSSMVLTSEVLKEHGDSIDRNIIQEKYFQSQLVELKKRKMISRSTSMEIQQQFEGGENVKEYITTGCQYSPQSRGTTSGGRYLESDDDSFKEEPSKSELRQNLVEEQFGTAKGARRDQNLGAGDSLPSSTQTAHSWIPGIQNSRCNTTGVGKARSFEYLPGHIYESSGNLREELPSETEQNLITSCSSDSDTAKGSRSNGEAGDSEGRNTLILENSTENSYDSDRLKILDENLAQLNFAVLKLREKDAQVQSLTQSLLMNLWKKMSFGDSLALGAVSTSKTEPKNKDSPDNEREGNNTLSEISTQELKKDTKEFSIACQTELKSQSSDSEKFFEQRKNIEKRISEEKRYQIKWIENEIQHLNILRELLEKQNGSTQRKKKHSLLTLTLNDDKSEENHPKNIPKEICPRAVTPVYGCTISISEKSNCASEENNTQAREQGCHPQYGMAVSLSGNSKNWQRLVMLPVDLQVSVKDTNLLKASTNCDADKDTQSCSHREHSSKSHEPNMVRDKQIQSDMCTQCPTPRKTSGKVLTSSQTDFSSPKRSSQCNHDNLCINLSGNSSMSVSRSYRSKSIEEKNCAKLSFQNEKSESENENKLCPMGVESKYYPVCAKEGRQSADESSNLSESYKSKSVQNENCKCQKTLSKSESSGACAKHTPNQTKNCKCQNCPKQLPSSARKQQTENSCKCFSQSNTHLTSDDCRCSKIQVHKSHNCACHIIKIHGARCCSSERNSCSCRGRNPTKKTENQSCQTDCDGVQQPMEGNISKKETVSKDLPYSTKDTDEELYHKSSSNSSYRKKADDHPRHYFLRIEEKEVDELNKPEEQKKSLEVITVTIPVKKAGKGKIYDPDIGQALEQCKSFPDLPSKECNCCENCKSNYQTPPQDYETGFSSGYSKSRAEKPESPKRNSGIIKPHEKNQYDDFYPKECIREFSFPQQFYQDDEFVREESVSNEFQGYEKCTCVQQNAPLRGTQKEYDSHKRRKSFKENYNGGNRFCEGRREYEQQEVMSQNCGRQCEGTDLDSGSKHFRGQKLSKEAGSGNPDYYNYNKREFMTKSEIRKEEEQKRKVQPSLQEYLYSNRPDFYNSAERRREIISERTKERLKRKNSRMDCLMKMLHHCNEKERSSKEEPKRIFTSVQMREQTLKRYKKLPEVTEKIADQKKKNEYRTNRLMADVFAKKLQIEALKGHINLSNSVSVLNTI